MADGNSPRKSSLRGRLLTGIVFVAAAAALVAPVFFVVASTFGSAAPPCITRP